MVHVPLCAESLYSVESYQRSTNSLVLIKCDIVRLKCSLLNRGSTITHNLATFPSSYRSSLFEAYAIFDYS